MLCTNLCTSFLETCMQTPSARCKERTPDVEVTVNFYVTLHSTHTLNKTKSSIEESDVDLSPCKRPCQCVEGGPSPSMSISTSTFMSSGSSKHEKMEAVQT